MDQQMLMFFFLALGLLGSVLSLNALFLFKQGFIKLRDLVELKLPEPVARPREPATQTERFQPNASPTRYATTPQQHSPPPPPPTSAMYGDLATLQPEIDALWSGDISVCHLSATISVTKVQLLMFGDAKTAYDSPPHTNLLYFAGLLSRSQTYGKGFSRDLSARLLPKIKEIAASKVKDSKDSPTLDIYWTHLLVTLLQERVSIRKNEKTYTGMLRCADPRDSHCPSHWSFRVSRELDHEVVINFDDLSEGAVTISKEEVKEEGIDNKKAEETAS